MKGILAKGWAGGHHRQAQHAQACLQPYSQLILQAAEHERGEASTQIDAQVAQRLLMLDYL